MNYDRFINSISASRKFNLIRELANVHASSPPGAVFLAGGMPDVLSFPFKSVSIDLKDESTIKIDGKLLETALQYQPSQGFGPLIKQLKDFQTRTHKLDATYWEENDVLVSTGSLDAFSKALEMCLESGQPIMINEPVYPGTTSVIEPLNAKMVPLQQDNFGPLPESLRAALEKEGSAAHICSNTKGVPKLLCLNPTGANPSGVTISAERKRKIYNIACEYDLLILEDDPYYFLHFEEKNPASFLSMDTENRVLRFDSFSKVISSGLRIGFVTGPKQLIRRIELHMTPCQSRQTPSGMGILILMKFGRHITLMEKLSHTKFQVPISNSVGMVIVHCLLAQWGFEGLEAHFKSVQALYKSKRDCMLAAAERHLTGLAEWNEPPAGMYLWLKVLGINDTHQFIMEGGKEYGVFLMPGKHFLTNTNEASPYVRASYSLATPKEINIGFERFAKMIRKELHQQQVGI